MLNFSKIVTIFLIIGSLTACSTISNDPYVESGVVGGAAGTVIGAGTGAIIGATIANGDVAASALLGGAIGLPAGVLLGLAIHAHNEDSEIEANNKIIRENYTQIIQRQQQIDTLREEVENDYKSINLDEELRRDIYTGPTLGNRQR